MARIRPRGSGTTEYRAGHWWTRISLPDGSRPRYRLCLDTCTCSTMSPAMVAERSRAISERKRAQVSAELAARDKELRERQWTVRQLGEAWTSGELLREHGEANGLRPKGSAKEDRYRLGIAFSVPLPSGGTFGDRRVADVTEHDAQIVMAKAPGLALARRIERWKKKDERGPEPEPWRPATRLQLYQVLHRLFELAAVPCRLRARDTNPFVEELRPRVKPGDLIFQWLYPDEVVALLACPSVPLVRRVLYAVAVWTGQRKESLRSLRWRHVDFEHAALTSPAQKNGVPLTFDLSPDLLELLKAWRAHEGEPAADRPLFPSLGRQPASMAVHGRRMTLTWKRLPEALRADLLTAGVTRAALQGGEEHEEPLRFHDLRATMVVWALKDPTKGYGWATDRTGHLSPRMLSRYDRAARNWREARFQPFPPLVADRTAAIPELSTQLSNADLGAA